MTMRYFEEPGGAVCAYDDDKQAALVDAALAAGWTDLGDIPPPSPPPAPAHLLSVKKHVRQAAVDAITVTTATGKVFDGDETAQGRMARAILTAEIIGQTETTWVLADDTPTPVTLDELKEALALSMQAQAAVWTLPYEEGPE